MLRLTIVVPCYNEAKRFPVERFRDYVRSRDGLRFLLVNDGSKDDTLAVLERVREGLEDRIGIFDMPQNGGKGEAVRHGILEALDQGGSDAIGFWDADLATPLEAIPELSGILEERPDIEMVFGARVKLLGRKIERLLVRHYLGRVFATVVSNLIRLPIYDTQCGAKIFRVVPGTRVLFAEPFCTRWVFDVEILARLIRRENRNMSKVQGLIYGYPLKQWEDVAGSKVKSTDFLKAFKDILKIYAKYLR